MTGPASVSAIKASLHRALADPGSVTERDKFDGLEPMHEWQARAVLQAAAPLIAAAERKRIREHADRLKFTLFRPGNGPAHGQQLDVIPFDEFVEALGGVVVSADCGCVFKQAGRYTFVHLVWCGTCALLAFKATGAWPGVTR